MTEAPENEEGVAEAIRDAAASRRPVELVSGGTRGGLGRPVQAAERVSLAGLGGVTLYEPGELTLVAQAGTPMAEIEALLEAENQQLTFEPPDHRALLGSSGVPTLGGAVSVGASGPRRLRMGACRDAVLGMRYVNGRGEALRAGGRVMKNVTGYDIARLLCGAYGTLGAITEVSLKTMPKAETEVTLALSGLSDDRAVAAMAAALALPVDVSAAAHLPASLSKELGFTEAVTVLRVEGFEAQVAHRKAMIQEALKGFGALEPIATNPWPAIRDCMVFAGDARAVWRVSIKPTDAPKYIKKVSDLIDIEIFYDWGGGLIQLAVEEGADAQTGAVRGALAGFDGYATLVRASAPVRAAVPVFQPEVAPLAALSEKLKAAFDPAGVFNPGRMRG